MNLWQRVAFSVFSLFLGWFAFDFVLMAIRYMREFTGNGEGEMYVRFLKGCGILILFFLCLALYFYVLRKLSGNLNIVEYEKAEEKPKLKSKWFDIILQGGLFLTGFFLKFFFLMVFYFPRVTA